MSIVGDQSQLHVDVRNGDLVAGQQVEARVRVGVPDDRVVGGRLELLYRNTYDCEGHHPNGSTGTVTRTTDVVVDRHCFGDAANPVRRGEFTASLRLPSTAPPSSPGSVDWVVRAVLDRRHRWDVNAEAPLTVRSRAEHLADWARTAPESPPGCRLAFDLPSRVVRPGDRLTGAVRMRPDDDLSIRRLLVRLRRVRLDEDDNRDDETMQEAVAAQSLELRAGGEHVVPFAVTLPPEAPPSFSAAHNEQRWFVEVVLDRKLRRDQAGGIEVLVHNG